MRMRRRRVERCLLRASVAIEAGVLDDAREAIDEIRRLDPNEPGLELLDAQLTDAANPPLIEQLPVEQPAVPALVLDEVPAAGSRRFATAAALLVVSAAAGAWLWSSSSRTAPKSGEIATAAAPLVQQTPADVPNPSVRISETSVAAAISAERLRPGDAPIATSGLAAVSDTSARPDLQRAENVEPLRGAADASAAAGNPARDLAQGPLTNPVTEQRQGFADSRSAAAPPSIGEAPAAAPPAPAPPARLEPLSGLPETAPASPRAVSGAEGIATPDAAARSAAALTTLPSPPAPAPAPAPARSDEQNVRAALSRYESAYSRLDAAAAASVWPGVNQRALANAFEGLSAQSVSLGQCDIRVSGTTARAECSGNARWTPKVGGAQTAQRQWRFDLRNAGGNWLITQATTR